MKNTAFHRGVKRSKLLKDLDEMGWSAWVASGKKEEFDQLAQDADSISRVEVKHGRVAGYDSSRYVVDHNVPSFKTGVLEYLGKMEVNSEDVPIELILKQLVEPLMDQVIVQRSVYSYEDGTQIWSVRPKLKVRLSGEHKRSVLHVATKFSDGVLRFYLVSPTLEELNKLRLFHSGL